MTGQPCLSGGEVGDRRLLRYADAFRNESQIDLIESRERENGSQCLLGSVESVESAIFPIKNFKKRQLFLKLFLDFMRGL